MSPITDDENMLVIDRTIHSLDLLGVLSTLAANVFDRILDFLGRCQDPIEGGFAGGPGQAPHLAPTYASVNAIVAIAHAYEKVQPGARDRTLAMINRQRLYEFILRMKDASGGFSVSLGGEVDTR
jgi:protein farnesyltransferase subunit beta